MMLIIANGSELDNSKIHNIRAFRLAHSAMLDNISPFGEKSRSNTQLFELIEHKHCLKNTGGYAINALTNLQIPWIF